MDSDWLLKTKQKTKWGIPSWKWCPSALVSFRKEPWLRLKTCASPRFMIGCLRWKRIVYDILTPNNIESLWWKYNSVPENSASKLFSSNNNVLVYYSILSRIWKVSSSIWEARPCSSGARNCRRQFSIRCNAHASHWRSYLCCHFRWIRPTKELNSKANLFQPKKIRIGS